MLLVDERDRVGVRCVVSTFVIEPVPADTTLALSVVRVGIMV